MIIYFLEACLNSYILHIVILSRVFNALFPLRIPPFYALHLPDGVCMEMSSNWLSSALFRLHLIHNVRIIYA